MFNNSLISLPDDPEVKRRICRELFDISRSLQTRLDYSFMISCSEDDYNLLKNALECVKAAFNSLSQYNWEVI